VVVLCPRPKRKRPTKAVGTAPSGQAAKKAKNKKVPAKVKAANQEEPGTCGLPAFAQAVASRAPSSQRQQLAGLGWVGWVGWGPRAARQHFTSHLCVCVCACVRAHVRVGQRRAAAEG